MAQQDPNILAMISRPAAGLSQIGNSLYQYGQDKDRQVQQNRLNTIQDTQIAEESKARKLQMMQQVAPAMVNLFSSTAQLPPEQRAGYLQQNKQLFDYAGIDMAQMDANDVTDEGLQKLSGVFSPYASMQNKDAKAFQPVVMTNDKGQNELVMPTFTKGVVGSQRVPMPEGFSAAVETPQQKREREAQSKIIEEQGKVLGKGAGETANAAFKQIESIKSNNRNLREVIRLVGTGADTGPIAKKLPSIRAASIRLDNMRGQLGLDVVGATTFGALSEAELNMALDTGLPTGLQGPELKSWAQDKINAQEKLAGYLEQQAKFLSRPGNTVADWLDEVSNQAEQNQPVQSQAASVQQSTRLPSGVTEDDIQETMRANSMTRAQVMQRLGVK